MKPIHFAHFAVVLALSLAAVLPAGAQLISFEALNTIHVSENAGILKIGILRAGSNETTSKVRYRLVDVVVLSPSSGELVFAAGEQRQEILLTVADDSKSAQGGRFGTLVLYDPEGALLSPEGNPGPVVAEQSRDIFVIDNEFTRDDPEEPPLEFNPASQSVAAGESVAKVRIRRLGDSGESLRLEFATLDETAKAGVHYLAQADSLTLAPLETEAILAVPLLAGPMADRELSFGLVLRGVENGQSWTNRGTLRIVDSRRPGTVDMSFDAGLLEGNLPAGGPWWSTVEDMALLPDGRLYIGGHLHTVQGTPRDGIARLLPNGRLDFAFREHAWDFHLGADTHWLSVQPDGRVVTGIEATHMRRFFPDGTGDASFVPADALIPARAGFEAPNMEMRLDGNALPRLVRILPDGREDPSFQMADDFLAGGSILATAKQSDGKILIGGYFPGAIVRLNADGTQDTSFDVGTGARVGNGVSEHHGWIDRILTQPDDQILVSGQFEHFDGFLRANLARLNGDRKALRLGLSNAASGEEVILTVLPGLGPQTEVVIESATKLSPPDWRPVLTNFLTSSPTKISLPRISDASTRFYRAVTR